MILFCYAGIIISVFILVQSILNKPKKRDYKVREQEIGDESVLKGYYNCSPMDVIILEGGFVVNETLFIEEI